MKVRLIAIVVALLVVYGLLIGTGSLANQEAQRATQRFNINPQGSLLEWFDADGTSLTKKIVGDGFKLNYKTRDGIRSVSAIGMKTKGLRSSSKPKLEGNTATAIARTADEALEITSSFTFDPNAGELIIKRKFRNISRHSVTLQRVWNYVDPVVMVRGGASKYANLDLCQITAGLSPHDCEAGECPVGPLCPPFPPGCPKPESGYYRAWLYPSKKRVVLGWPTPLTLKPEQYQQPADESSIVIRVVIK